MAERLVINTGPLVALGRTSATAAVARMPFEVIAPMEVRRELDAGAATGHVRGDVSWVRFVALKRPLSALATSNLDPGEAAVIQLALDEGIEIVCIDERKGRRAALAVGLRITGTLGLLGRAKALGLLPSVRPIVEEMVASGDWFDEELLARFYTAIGE